MVNERLGKPEFDCLTLDKTYDCGCGPESASLSSTASQARETAADVFGGWAEEVGTSDADFEAEGGSSW